MYPFIQSVNTDLPKPIVLEALCSWGTMQNNTHQEERGWFMAGTGEREPLVLFFN